MIWELNDQRVRLGLHSQVQVAVQRFGQVVARKPRALGRGVEAAGQLVGQRFVQGKAVAVGGIDRRIE